MILSGARCFSAERGFETRDLFIEGERIAESATESDRFDASGLYAIPGLVDIHFHGAAGHDFCDGDREGLAAIAEYEAKSGVLAICPATMTYSEEILNRVIDNAVAFRKEDRKTAADLVGINMEGPFISPKRIGAQNPKYLHKPDAKMFRRLNERAEGLIRLVDIAPEEEGGLDFVSALKDEVRISLAHNVCDYETAKKAFALGAKHMTHLYNAMPGITHREPGPIVAALENDATVELIADGIHIHPAMVRFTFRVFNEEKVILIADSMEATGLPDGSYQLGGQGVTVTGNLAVLSEHPETIAGSVTNLYDCMKTAVLKMGVPLAQAVRAASFNPAKAIGVDEDYGSLETGRYANILLVNEKLELVKVMKKGVFL